MGPENGGEEGSWRCRRFSKLSQVVLVILAAETFSSHSIVFVIFYLFLPAISALDTIVIHLPLKVPRGLPNAGMKTLVQRQNKNIKKSTKRFCTGPVLPIKGSADLSQEASACPLSRDRVKMEEIHERNQR